MYKISRDGNQKYLLLNLQKADLMQAEARNEILTPGEGMTNLNRSYCRPFKTLSLFNVSMTFFFSFSQPPFFNRRRKSPDLKLFVVNLILRVTYCIRQIMDTFNAYF